MKDKENNNYIIYKAVNISNGAVYIGATSASLETRKKDHLKKSKKGKNYAFQNAIATYGEKAFTWKTVAIASSIDDLARKEKAYILKYNSKEEGYNIDGGGGIQKSVYQYDILTGKLVHKYTNLTTAGAVVSLNKQGLSKVCLSVNKVYKGFYWTYDFVDKFVPIADSRRREIHQLTLDREFVSEFVSVSEASKRTGCNKTSIAKVCRGERKSSGGFLWKYN